jgi:maleate isomerase
MPTYGTSDAMTAASLRGLAESPDLEDAADRLRGLRPAAVAYVDTSITFVRGPGGDVDINERLARFAGCPATCTGTAVLDALVALGLKNVAVVTPYPAEVNDWIPPFFATRDVTVESTAIMSTNYGNGADSGSLSQIGVDVLESAIRTVDSSSVDGIFISCTAVRTVDFIDQLEQTFGKPVVTSIQATVWRALQLAGLDDVRAGVGALFSGGSAVQRP